MRFLFTIQRLVIGLVLACMLLAGCQRASYSFQLPPATPVRASAAVSANTVAVLAEDFRVVSATAVRMPSGLVAKRRHISRHKRLVMPRPAGVESVSKKQYRPAITQRQPKKTKAFLFPTDDPKPYSKSVAFVLAVVLGLFGAHMFYLGRNGDGFRYLLFALFCATLCLIAMPVAMSVGLGSSVGGFFVLLFLLVAGYGGLALTYLHALDDAVRILRDKLLPLGAPIPPK
jgi:TM2 domain-containing membrane protein YozV